jgi:hypothetical protein
MGFRHGQGATRVDTVFYEYCSTLHSFLSPQQHGDRPTQALDSGKRRAR